MGDRRVIRAHDEAVRATLGFVEADLLQTRGWDPATRRRPRVKAEGMVVAGFRHLASRDQDPQLHTHCVLANMTRNASGEWRSVEPTKIRRSEKLIGAYYRNELALRLQALGMAVSPTLVGEGTGVRACGLRPRLPGRVLGQAPGDSCVPGAKGPVLHGEAHADGGAAHAPAQGGQGPRGPGAGMARAGAGTGSGPGEDGPQAGPAARPGDRRAGGVVARRAIVTPQYRATSIAYRADRRATDVPNNS